MPKSSMKQALGASLSAEAQSFQSRLQKAEAQLEAGASTADGKREAATPIKAPPVLRVVREAFTIPEIEHSAIEALRLKMLSQAVAVSKSEVVRAGLLLLGEADDQTRREVFKRLEKVKTGRPKTTI